MEIKTLEQAIRRMIACGYMVAELGNGLYSVMIDDCELDRCTGAALITKANRV